VTAAYVDGLAGAMALVIAGSHGSKEDIINATVTKLREAVDRESEAPKTMTPSTETNSLPLLFPDVTRLARRVRGVRRRI